MSPPWDESVYCSLGSIEISVVACQVLRRRLRFVDSPSAWVDTDDERRREDERVRAGLTGRRIAGVRYYELHYGEPDEDPTPQWTGAVFDSLDFGLELDLAGGETWSCMWDRTGDEEGLLVYRGALAAELRPDTGPAVWDVSERWAALARGRIAAVTPVWTRHAWQELLAGNPWRRTARWGPWEHSLLCRVTLTLEFEGGAEIVVTLGERDEDGFSSSGDNVAVFFSVAEARAAGVLLPGDADAVVGV